MIDSNYIVTKQITFQRLLGGKVVFPVGTFIQYRRNPNGTITIWFSNSTPDLGGYTCDDFDIENYVEQIADYQPDNKPKEKPYRVQVKCIDNYDELNRFLKSINGEDVINVIEIPKHFSVVYKEYE